MNQESIEKKLLESLEQMKTANPKQKEQIIKETIKIITEHDQLSTLTNIINSCYHLDETKLAALHLIECHFKKFNHRNRSYFQIKDKEMNLIELVKICSSSYKLIKKYSKMLISYYSTCSAKGQICTKNIQNLFNDNSYSLKHIFTIILSLIQTFQFSITESQTAQFQKIALIFFPKIIEIIQQKDNPDIRYMVIKILWKIFHYKCTQRVKAYTSYIMPFIIDLMLSCNQLFDFSIEKLPESDRYTDKFYYLKSKKWATRIYLRFLQNHAKINVRIRRNDNNTNQFGVFWQDIYCLPNICRIIKQLSVPTLLKTKYFQLKAINIIIENYPKSLKLYQDILFYELLPKLYAQIMLQSKKQLSPNKKFYEIIQQRSDPSFMTNPKFISLTTHIQQIYTSLLTITLNNRESIIIFLQNLQAKIQCLRQEQSQNQMWIQILFRTKRLLNNRNYKESESNVIANSILMEQIQNPALMHSKYQNIRGYTFTLMTVADKISEQTYESYVKQCFHCLKQEANIFVRYYAANSLCQILTSHRYTRGVLNPNDYELITLKMIDLLKEGQREQSFNLINLFVNQKILSLDFSATLVIQIVNIFKTYNEQTKIVANEEDSLYFNLCHGCFKLIEDLLNNYKDIQLQIIEPALLQLINLIRDNEKAQMDNFLNILHLYLQLKKQITPISQFYFQLIFYKLIGSQRYFGLLGFHQHSTEIRDIKQTAYRFFGQNEEQMFKFILTFLKISHRQYDEVQFQSKVVLNLLKLSQVIFEGRNLDIENLYSIKACVVWILMKLIELTNDTQSIVHQNEETIEKIINLAYLERNKHIKIEGIQLATVYFQKNFAFIKQYHKRQLEKYLEIILTYKIKISIEGSVRVLGGINYLLENYQQIEMLAINCQKLLKAAAALIKNITKIESQVENNSSESQEVQAFQQSDIDSFQNIRDIFEAQNDQNIADRKTRVIQAFKKQISFMKFSRPLNYRRLTEQLLNEEKIVIQQYTDRRYR